MLLPLSTRSSFCLALPPHNPAALLSRTHCSAVRAAALGTTEFQCNYAELGGNGRCVEVSTRGGSRGVHSSWGCA